ncbi:MAG: hypothetical protein ABIQ95_08450 [Bdellovibrionia bacterium]
MKKTLSVTRRNVPDRKGGWLERIRHATRSRRAQVEQATGAPFGFVEKVGVKSGGIPDADIDDIATKLSGVPRSGSGMNRVRVARSVKEARVVGRIPTHPTGRGLRKRKKAPRKATG